MPLVKVGVRVLYNYSIDDMRPIDALNGNTVPILFIHGEADTTVPPQNARELYERAQGKRELHYIAGADHAESVLVAPKEYHETVSSFLETIK